MRYRRTGRILEYIGFLVVIVALARWSLVASGVAVGVAMIMFGRDLRSRTDQP